MDPTVSREKGEAIGAFILKVSSSVFAHLCPISSNTLLCQESRQKSPLRPPSISGGQCCCRFQNDLFGHVPIDTPVSNRQAVSELFDRLGERLISPP